MFVALMGLLSHRAMAQVGSGVHPLACGDSDPTCGGLYGVTIDPVSYTAPTRVANTGTYTQTFTIQNIGTSSSSYGVLATCTGKVTSCSANSSSTGTLASGGTYVSTVTYSVTTAGSGGIALYVHDPHVNTTGNVTVPVATYSVAVTPDGATAATRQTPGTYSESFNVQNTGTTAATFTLTCSGTGGIGCSAPANASTGLLQPGATIPVTAVYSVGSAGTATVSVTATALDARGTAYSDAGSFTVPVVNSPQTYGVTVSPHVGQGTSRATGTAGTEGFTVLNTGTGPTAILFSLSCTTAAPLSGCSVSPTSLTLASGASGSATVSFSAGAPGNGSITFTASSTNATDVGFKAVTVTTSGPISVPTAVLSSLRDETTIEKSQCVTIAIAENSAMECGRLRLVHPMPGIRTLNKQRTPTLLYNSGTAVPFPLLAVEATISGVPVTGDSIVTKLSVAGGAVVVQKWSATPFGDGRPHRISLAFDAAANNQAVAAGTTGQFVRSFAYTVEVGRQTSSTYSAGPTLSGTYAIVNRQKSSFGSGWWLAGLEYLDVPSMTWAGGDGSTRQYRLKTGSSSIWITDNIDAPDSLTYDGTNYTRWLQHGLRVVFNSAGRHVQTINRLGHITGFTYNTDGTLATIAVPTASTSVTYLLGYTSGYLTSFTGKYLGVGGTRATSLTNGPSGLTVIRDPDTTQVGFAYSGSVPGRIVSRTSKRGAIATFGYNYANTVNRVATALPAAADSIILSLFAGEAAGYSGYDAADTTYSIVTVLDGARKSTDVADVWRFYPRRFGAPGKAMDPLTAVTAYTRGDVRWPGLVTSVLYANGRRTLATYDSLAQMTALVDSGRRVGNAVAMTRYEWDPKWTFATKIVRPAGDSVQMAYDVTTGNRMWQQDGRGINARVTFDYYAGTNLLRATQAPLSARDSVAYDATLGNVSTLVSPLQYATQITTDEIGRQTVVRTPVDATGLRDSTTTSYDILDRARHSVSYGTAMSGASAQSVVVDNAYGPDGAVSSTSRSVSPDPAAIATLVTSWRYDLVGRKVAEIAPDGLVDSTTYDPAGNVIATRDRNGSIVMQTYDAMDRLKQRVFGTRAYAQDATKNIPNTGTNLHDVGAVPGSPFPFHPNNTSLGYTVQADTATFDYSIMGLLTKADNRYAQIRRAYELDGALATDSTWLRTWAPIDSGGSFTAHPYGLAYTYDLDGRRTGLTHPVALIPPTSTGKSTMAYDASSGLLASVTDVLGEQFTFGWDFRNNVRSVSYPSGSSGGTVYRLTGYDVNDQLIADTLKVNSSATLLRNTTLTYDRRGKMLSAANGAAVADTLTSAYSGLGYVVGTTFRTKGLTDGSGTLAFGSSGTTSFGLDPYGNQLVRAESDSTYTTSNSSYNSFSVAQNNDSTRYSATTGRMLRQSRGAARDSLAYDGAGQVLFKWQPSGGGGALDNRGSYYGSNGVLAASDYRWTANGLSLAGVENRIVFEEYRYDALGRRVEVLARKRCINAIYLGWCNMGSFRRIVWDGDRELWEIERPLTLTPDRLSDTVVASAIEQDTNAVVIPYSSNWGIDPSVFFGRVVYEYGLETDRPLTVTRVAYVSNDSNSVANGPATLFPAFTIIPLWNARGSTDGYILPNSSIYAAQRTLSTAGTHNSIRIDWPFTWRAYAGADIVPLRWHGSLIDDKMDEARTMYRRNRYYDPQTAQFTQEDPIGLGGGANLYGFANGDPVNFSDPFGLAACPPSCDGSATLTISFGATLGYIQAMGLQGGLAVDNDGRFSLFASYQKGVGIGGAIGGGIGVQKGQVGSLEGGTDDNVFHASDATTVTVAAGALQPSVTFPGKNSGGVGAGVGGAARKWGVGVGVFVTQTKTVQTTPTRPLLSDLRQTVSRLGNEAAIRMRCPTGC